MPLKRHTWRGVAKNMSHNALAEFAGFFGILRFSKKQKKNQIRVRAGAGPEAGAPPPRAPEFGVFLFYRKFHKNAQ